MKFNTVFHIVNLSFRKLVTLNSVIIPQLLWDYSLISEVTTSYTEVILTSWFVFSEQPSFSFVV